MKTNLFTTTFFLLCLITIGNSQNLVNDAFKLFVFEGNVLKNGKEITTEEAIFSDQDKVTLKKGGYLALKPRYGELIEFSQPGTYNLKNFNTYDSTDLKVNNFKPEFSFFPTFEEELDTTNFTETLQKRMTRCSKRFSCHYSSYDSRLLTMGVRHIVGLPETYLFVFSITDTNRILLSNLFDEPLLSRKSITPIILLDVKKLKDTLCADGYDWSNSLIEINEHIIINDTIENKDFQEYNCIDIQPSKYFFDQDVSQLSAAQYAFMGNYFAYSNRSGIENGFTDALYCYYRAIECAPQIKIYKEMLYDFLGDAFRLNGSRSYNMTGSVTRKPIIYLYPEKEKQVDLIFNYKGDVSFTYPDYHDGWSVRAKPTGELLNLKDSTSHYYLFWDGIAGVDYNQAFPQDTGFVVGGDQVIPFLQKTLKEIGLTPKEYNDFITFWGPEMQKNEYNQVYFAIDKQYDQWVSTMNVTPKPDVTLRVCMFYKKLNSKIDLHPQKFKPFNRKGFSLVEWGGAEVEETESYSIVKKYKD